MTSPILRPLSFRHPMPYLASTRRTLSALLLCGALAGCAVSAIEASHQMMAEGHTEEAVTTLREDMQRHPEDQALRVQYFRLRDQAINQALAAADRARQSGDTDVVETQARVVQRLDPENARARTLLRDLETSRQRTERLTQAQKLLEAGRPQDAEGMVRAILAETPGDSAARSLLRKIDEAVAAKRPLREDKALKGGIDTPITLEFREAPLRSVFEAISRTAGINFVFDKDVKPDAKVTVFVRNTNIDEVMRLILTTNQLERKVLNENSVIIYPATPAKQKDYQDLATRTFYLANTEAKQAQALVKSVVKTRDSFIDEGLNLLIIKDTPEAIRMAERLINQLDVPPPEVMLDVEVLEIQRSRLLDLGIKYPDQVGYGILQPTTSTTTTTTTGTTTSTNLGGQLLSGNINLNSTGAAVPYIANPGALANLKDQTGLSNTLANPRIRVRNREKAKIHIGDKLPVFTTTSTANVGVSAAVNYLDVGLMLEVEPTIRLDDDVEIKVGLEVSSISKEVTGPQNSLAYQIGTRNASTVLRLRDGETQVLAGLISDSERSTTYAIPGLGSIPALGRLFSDHSKDKSKTEIVLLITPHVVRNITPEASVRATWPAGTESAVGVPPLQVTANTPAGSLSVKGGNGSFSDSTGTSPTPTVEPQAPSGNTPAASLATVPGPAPQSPGNTEPAAAAAQPQSASISITLPQSVKPGQVFTTGIAVAATSAVRSAEVGLAWENSFFEPATPETTNTISLTPSGNTASGQISLRAKTGASGEGKLSVSAARITLESGAVEAATPPSASIKVSP
jgi:general secretion pathway protein D